MGIKNAMKQYHILVFILIIVGSISLGIGVIALFMATSIWQNVTAILGMMYGMIIFLWIIVRA